MAQDPYICVRKKFSGNPPVTGAYTAETNDEDPANQGRIF
jgi:hypothetical protein